MVLLSWNFPGKLSQQPFYIHGLTEADQIQAKRIFFWALPVGGGGGGWEFRLFANFPSPRLHLKMKILHASHCMICFGLETASKVQ